MRLPLAPLLVLSVAFAVPQSAQEREATRPRTVGAPADSVKLGVDLVLMDVQVSEKDTGKVFGDLKKEDFVLKEDGAAQQIAQFGRGSEPLSVVILVDRAGCLDPVNENVRAATLEALHRLDPRDEVALMAYSDRVDLVAPFSRDHDRVGAAFDRMPPHQEEAEHCLSLAVFDAAEYLMRSSNPFGRRVIVFVTGVTRAIDCGGKSNRDALQEVYESGSVVCAILPRSAMQRMENGMTIGMIGMAGKFGAPTTSLDKLAEQTGGEVVSAKTDELNAKFGGLVERLRTRYTLGFVSTNAKFDGAFRELALDLSPAARARLGKKAVVRTRHGYVATPPKVAPAP